MAVPRLERLEQTLVAAYVPAANAALQSLQEGIHKAVLPVQRAVDEFSTYVSAKAKPRGYVPSGVRPRLLLLPCVVLSIMTIPILSIFLPVYFTADHDSRQEAKNFISVCTVFPTPDEVVVAAYQKPMSSANQSLISIFMHQLQTECQQVEPAWAMSKDADGGAVDMSQLLLDELLGSFTNWANISNGERANTSMPALAGWVLTDMRLSALDLEAGRASISIRASPNSLFAFNTGYGVWNNQTQALQLPEGMAIQVDVFSDLGGKGSLRLQTGDRQAVLGSKIPLQMIRHIFYYPFDIYRFELELSMLTSNADVTVELPMAFLTRTSNQMTGWVMQAEPITSPLNQYMSEKGNSYIRYSVTVQRSSNVRFSIVLIFVCLWIMVACACCFAFDAVYLRPRDVPISGTDMLFALSFAVYGVRNVLPAAPLQSVGMDYFGFICLMLMLMLSGASMLANQHRWHVSPTPTVWDRLVQRIQTCRTASAERTNQEASTANKDGIATGSLGKGCAGA